MDNLSLAQSAHNVSIFSRIPHYIPIELLPIIKRHPKFIQAVFLRKRKCVGIGFPFFFGSKTIRLSVVDTDLQKDTRKFPLFSSSRFLLVYR